jgi:type IV pilus assembly protein PilY1
MAADWDAADVLTGPNGETASPSPDARNIYTARMRADRSFETVEFKWDKLDHIQQMWLNASPINNKDDGLGAQRVSYLRGARELETGRPNGIFRARDRILGDIVNSNPVYVGPPTLHVQGRAYQKFYEDYQGRTTTVYVGANDGMLHAFSAVDGKELFAYIPNALMQSVNQLTSPEYRHRPYVDGAISISEALVGAKWRTVLASGMGGGAQGIFALDVSNPADFSRGMGAIWEFTDSDDADMGNLLGAPLIAKFRMKTVNGVPEFRYFVVVPSGLNNYADDGYGKFDGAAPGVLFLLSLDKAPSSKWELGVNYYKFKTPITNLTQPNGLSTPGLAFGSDGAVRYAYAGDLQGNLWRFNFSGSAPWSNALGPVPHPLFSATDADGMRQPITAQPKAVFAPGGGYVVLFGTGKFIEYADTAPGSFRTQSFYAIHDSTRDADKLTSRSQLVLRILTSSGIAGNDALTLAGRDFMYGTSAEGKRGWYVDFLDSNKTGERSVTDPLIAYGRVFFNTVIPGNDPCTGGGGRVYALDVLTGLPFSGAATGFLSAVGLLGVPVLFETGAAEIGDRNAIGRRSVKKKYSVFNFGTGGPKGMAAPVSNGAGEATSAAGRLSWREILNWRELRAVADTK